MTMLIGCFHQSDTENAVEDVGEKVEEVADKTVFFEARHSSLFDNYNRDGEEFNQIYGLAGL